MAINLEASRAARTTTVDYEPGAVLRGFRLLCEWDSEIKEVAFVIRTDAIPEEEPKK
ncbi:hypothetical protein LBW89_09270 [Paenibacillus sp. alder61]|uniref:hypothetical protein n=1 Tax=Paenibacillus TaxID=44249 RepID=UPI001478E477|nr:MULTISPECIES: hypothetical protein [Paenibacillus]MCA1293209.1 hypothetical protein [Paenibacillus sp. alder61]